MIISFLLTTGLGYVVFCWGQISMGDFCSSTLVYPINLYFGLDQVSYLLGITTIVLWIGVVVCFHHSCGVGFISSSALCSLLCFSSSNSLCFWIFYEVSILFLLYKLFRDSPYSERPLACWYFASYIVLTSLPLVLCIIYLGICQGTFNLNSLYSSNIGLDETLCLCIMAVAFIVKMPLFPFHSWLPVVHAESPNVVSVCLSGYIMKLGFYGLYRFCWDLLPGLIFCPSYVFAIVIIGLIFFCACQRELDGKRWVAFMSLAHMSCSCYGACIVTYCGFSYPLLNCFGHGLTSASSFIALSLAQSLSGSRSWSFIKSVGFSLSLSGLFIIVSIIFEASLPPSLSFFSELFSLCDNILIRFSMVCAFSIYMFIGGLAPLLTLCYIHTVGHLSNPEDCSLYCYYVFLVWIQFMSMSVFIVYMM